MPDYDGLMDTDFDAFQQSLDADPTAAGLFAPDSAPVFAARAPGRLDVMGGIADYSGSLVAEMPIRQAAVVAAQRDDPAEGAVTVVSANAAEANLTPKVVLPAEVFTNPVSLLRWLRDCPPPSRWAGYAAGALSILRAEGLVPRKAGARLFVRSEVPLGAGVSSSAAIEVASMRAICAAFEVPLSDGLVLARLCQRVEHEVLDAPCGIMDQVTSALGEAGKLLLLLCQPYQVQGTVALPPGYSVFGIDSGVTHSVAGDAYTKVRVAAFMGYKILADKAGSGFSGYLCNVSPDTYKALIPERLPETMNGAAFLGAHGGTFDTVTSVEPTETYPVRAAAEHAIHEMVRVTRFVECLREGSEGAMQEAAIHMLASHDSYSKCGLGSRETDLLVSDATAHEAVLGAKITGGGSGGTVCVLCREDAEERMAKSIADEYQIRTGLQPRIIRGTSPGALASEVRQVKVG
ncbi:MAG: GHMP kinase [Cytophagales bacterium]|nr:GHMP kinase [Armatimonadota bacterium]